MYEIGEKNIKPKIKRGNRREVERRLVGGRDVKKDGVADKVQTNGKDGWTDRGEERVEGGSGAMILGSCSGH